MTATCALIAAVAANGVIGRDNALPWHISADLKRFRALTTGHAIIMGRKTFESIGRPLPQRRNMVVSSTLRLLEGIEVFPSLAAAVAAVVGEQQAFIIGGASLYREGLPAANRVYLTELAAPYNGNVWFPHFDPRDWRVIEREPHPEDESVPGGYAFVTYERLGAGELPAPDLREEG